jgi:hypothetical protein
MPVDGETVGRWDAVHDPGIYDLAPLNAILTKAGADEVKGL